MVNFLADFKQVMKSRGVSHRYTTPNDLINEYEKFAAKCLNLGYDDCLEEYDNDIAVRGFIESAMQHPLLHQHPEMKGFVRRVKDADQIMRAAFMEGQYRDDERLWWQKGIVKKGYDLYAEHIKAKYGVEIL